MYAILSDCGTHVHIGLTKAEARARLTELRRKPDIENVYVLNEATLEAQIQLRNREWYPIPHEAAVRFVQMVSEAKAHALR